MSDIVIKYEHPVTSNNYDPEIIATFKKVDYKNGSDDFLIFQNNNPEYYSLRSVSTYKKINRMQILDNDISIKKDLSSLKVTIERQEIIINPLIFENRFCQDNVFNLYNLICNKLSDNSNEKYNVENKIKKLVVVPLNILFMKK